MIVFNQRGSREKRQLEQRANNEKYTLEPTMKRRGSGEESREKAVRERPRNAREKARAGDIRYRIEEVNARLTREERQANASKVGVSKINTFSRPYFAAAKACIYAVNNGMTLLNYQTKIE